ncbi:MAG: ASPIC/UnbV domain-containing protein, partial [Planctomycetota bacterium]|nr:ASPIC/UnbV domain-containing protein [Planctomycetota bacterium]
LEISHMTSADIDGDSRAVLALDLFEPGQLDLLVRQVGGGSLRVFKNQFEKSSYLKVSLSGNPSNALGIGSRLVAHVGGRKIVRELFPINTYQSQHPSWVHFGLGKATKIDKLEIFWPSGLTQEITDIQANRHILVTEGVNKIGDYAHSIPSRKPQTP